MKISIHFQKAYKNGILCALFCKELVRLNIKIGLWTFLFMGLLMIVGCFFFFSLITGFVMRLFGMVYTSGFQLLSFFVVVLLMTYPFYYLIRMLLGRYLARGWHFNLMDGVYYFFMFLILNPCLIASAHLFDGFILPTSSRIVGSLLLALPSLRFKFFRVFAKIGK